MITVFYFYGVSFIILGIVIISLYREEKSLGLQKDLWLLGLFGLTHGLLEFTDLLILKGVPFDIRILDVLSAFLLPLSFIFLVVFALRVMCRYFPRLKGLRFLWLLNVFIVMLTGAVTRDALTVKIMSRYFLGLPGCLLTGLNLIIVLSKSKRPLPGIIWVSTAIAATTFIIYGILSGLVVPPAPFFPASVVNTATFKHLFGIPVQCLRMVCAIVITISFYGVIGLMFYDKRTVRLLFVLIFAMFISDFMIMVTMNAFLAPIPVLYNSLIDSSLLILIAYPVLYQFIFKPMLNEISQRKEAEENVRKVNLFLEERVMARTAQLQEANHLKELFADIMRHDLLNPITVIKRYTELIHEKSKDEKISEFALLSIKSLTKMTDMIVKAQMYAKLENVETLEHEDVNLMDILKDAFEGLKNSFEEKNLHVEIAAQGESPCRANRMIENVFSNLLSNALKYSLVGNRIEAGIADEGESYKIHVKDWGAGINDDDKGRIFNRFERAGKKGVRGLGLGLAIVKRLVELHRGTVWVENNPEGGSVFYVRIPKEES